jgi:hypothetical protein
MTATTPDARQSPEQAGDETQDHQEEGGHHADAPPLPSCSMEVLTLDVIFRKTMWAGEPVRRNLRYRPR